MTANEENVGGGEEYLERMRELFDEGIEVVDDEANRQLVVARILSLPRPRSLARRCNSSFESERILKQYL